MKIHHEAHEAHEGQHQEDEIALRAKR